MIIITVFDPDLQAPAPSSADIAEELAQAELIKRQRVRVFALTTVSLVAMIVWVDAAQVLSRDHSFALGFGTGLICFPMLLWALKAVSRVHEFKPADAHACADLESLMNRPEIARYVQQVQEQGRFLTAGEARALESIAGYCRAQDEEAKRQAAYQRIHSLTNCDAQVQEDSARH